MLAGLLFFGSFSLKAGSDWNSTSKLFKYQKGIDNSISAYSAAMATIYFNDTLFNFILYDKSIPAKIILRKLYNTSTSADSVNFDYIKQDEIVNLSSAGDSPPDPVIFKNSLYLFFTNASNTAVYSVYNTGAWSAPVSLPWSGGNYRSMQAAAVINDKLCLVSTSVENANGCFSTYLEWTTDLIHWNEITINNCTQGATAIAKTYLESDTLKYKLMVGYLDNNFHARCADYRFNKANQPVLLVDKVIANDDEYSSIAFAEGSVNGDPNATGDCVQAFLKKVYMDCGQKAYMIKRCQLTTGGTWTNPESNLLPLTQPSKMWAEESINLTAATFPVIGAGTGNIRQYMCLIYVGYDGKNPLNCAWAETDHLLFDKASSKSVLLDTSSLVQFIGYIEGVPPYYFNGGNTSVFNATDLISEAEYTYSSSVGNASDVSVDVSGELSAEIACFKPSLSYTYGKQMGHDTTVTVTGSVGSEPGPGGIYFTLQPQIKAYLYNVYDWKNNLLYPTYYFKMSQPAFAVISVDTLPNRLLVPGNPASYIHRCITSDNNTYATSTASWADGHPFTGQLVLETGSNATATHTFKVGADVSAEIFSVKFGIKAEGSLEGKMTTTSTQDYEIKYATRLNAKGSVAAYPNDIVGMNYTACWLLPTSGMNNWWLYPGQDTTEKTWCVAYEVTKIIYNNGVTLEDTIPCPFSHNNGSGNGGTVNGKPGDTGNPDAGYFLFQNCPNPFTSSTKFKFTLGKDQQANSGDKGCLTKLVVYDLSGTEVAVLVNEPKVQGNYEVTRDASHFAPGIYYYSLESGNFRNTRILVLLK